LARRQVPPWRERQAVAYLPVVLVVWDVNLREGRWALVDDLIQELDQRRPQWRENKSKARVRLPWGNGTDEEGLVRLWRCIGKRLYPLLARGRLPEAEIALNFPDTEEGKASLEKFNDFLKNGGHFQFDSNIKLEIKSVSQWFEIWFGKPDIDELEIFPPHRVFPGIALALTGNKGVRHSPSKNELKVIKVGLETVTLSNVHQKCFLQLRCIVSKLGEMKFSLQVNSTHFDDIQTVRKALHFLKAVALGGTLRFISSPLDKVFGDIPVPTQPPRKQLNPIIIEIVDKLCFIQEKIEPFISWPSEGVIRKDIEQINRLAKIIKKGKLTIQHNYEGMSSKFQREALSLILDSHRKDEPVQFNLSYIGSHVEFFNLTIPTGPVTQWVTAKPKISVFELETIWNKLKFGDQLPVEFSVLQIVEIFPDWYIREAERLSHLLAENFEVEAIYLFGSLVWGDVWTKETDIDLAVRGLPPEQYFKAMGFLERESSFPTDLVEIANVSDYLQHRILTEGKILYEREPVTAVSR
jgi:predicted nucleotidyltransferase